MLLKNRSRAGSMCRVDLSWILSFVSLWKKVWAFLGPAGNALQWFYSVNGRFHLFIKRSWFWVTNATAHWNASFVIEPEDPTLSLPTVLEAVAKKLSVQPGFQIFRDHPENKVIRAGGVLFDLSCFTGVLHVQVADQSVSFRDSKEILQSQLLPIVEQIENAVGSARRQYSLTAHFRDKENPYLSVYLRRIDKDLINTFQCTYNPARESPGVTVSVNLENINIVAESREVFRTEALKVLALSGP